MPGLAAITTDGAVITWGAHESDFASSDDQLEPFTNAYQNRGGDSQAVSNQLLSGVTEITSNHSAFAALKDDGSVVTWGLDDFGGDSSSVSNLLSSGVEQIASADGAWAIADGSSSRGDAQSMGR